MKILPFFFPLGFVTPTGVIMLSFGIPSSASVYTFDLRFLCSAAAVCGRTWLAGVGFPPLFGFRGRTIELLTGARADLLVEMPDLLAACLFLTVLVRVGAIFATGFPRGIVVNEGDG
jgi:hypothetical protein